MYKHVVLWKLKDEAAFKRYCSYPEHDAVVAYITSGTEAEKIMDYTI